MNELVDAYIDFLISIKEVNKHPMPNIDVNAYTESEYLYAMREINDAFKDVDDLHITENFVKGE